MKKMKDKVIETLQNRVDMFNGASEKEANMFYDRSCCYLWAYHDIGLLTKDEVIKWSECYAKAWSKAVRV